MVVETFDKLGGFHILANNAVIYGLYKVKLKIKIGLSGKILSKSMFIASFFLCNSLVPH